MTGHVTPECSVMFTSVETCFNQKKTNYHLRLTHSTQHIITCQEQGQGQLARSLQKSSATWMELEPAEESQTLSRISEGRSQSFQTSQRSLGSQGSQLRRYKNEAEIVVPLVQQWGVGTCAVIIPALDISMPFW